jgi:two-component system, OmpR family, response regulator CpxR
MRAEKVILCVDDNEQDLSVLQFILATNGYRTLGATDGREAIRIFASTDVDVVLSDYAMPQMNGSELISQLKQLKVHVPMILLSDPRKHANGSLNADVVIPKQKYSFLELLERLRIVSIRGVLRSREKAQLSEIPRKSGSLVEFVPLRNADSETPKIPIATQDAASDDEG